MLWATSRASTPTPHAHAPPALGGCVRVLRPHHRAVSDHRPVLWRCHLDPPTISMDLAGALAYSSALASRPRESRGDEAVGPRRAPEKDVDRAVAADFAAPAADAATATAARALARMDALAEPSSIQRHPQHANQRQHEAHADRFGALPACFGSRDCTSASSSVASNSVLNMAEASSPACTSTTRYSRVARRTLMQIASATARRCRATSVARAVQPAGIIRKRQQRGTWAIGGGTGRAGAADALPQLTQRCGGNEPGKVPAHMAGTRMP